MGGFLSQIAQKEEEKTERNREGDLKEVVITTTFYNQSKREIGREVTTQILDSYNNVKSQQSKLTIFVKPGKTEKPRVIGDEDNRVNKCIEMLGLLEDVVIENTFERLQKLSRQRGIASNKFSLNYIYRTLLDQISIDLNIIHQALQQRRLITEKDRKPLYTHQGFVLFIADLLASHAIAHAVQAGALPAETTVLTYLRNSIDVRLVPYHDVILLGIPYSTLNINPIKLGGNWFATDYLAIPHEMGHHLFWYGHVPGSDKMILDALIEKLGLQETVPAGDGAELIDKLEKTNWIVRWLEEIFADAYGCLIAGPISILSFQEMLTDSHHEDDNHKNGVRIIPEEAQHPVPELRPLIQSKILRQAELMQDREKSGAISNQLDTNWKEWVAQNWGDANLLDQMYRFEGSGEERSGQDIMDALGSVISAILSTLEETVRIKETQPWIMYCDSLRALYEEFTSGKFISQLIVAAKPEKIPGNTAVSHSRRKNTTLLPTNWELKAKNPVRLTKNMVREILFHGWSTEGPEGSHPGRG
jgi:hypothetical protein